jgi:hypothetical protein
VAVKFVAADAGLVLRGTVVRSRVAVLNGAEVKYHTAVAFDDDITLCEDSTWTDSIEDGGEAPGGTTGPDVPREGELQVVATVEGPVGDLEELLAGNDW